ncbi:periplasmic protein [Candidatus Scalindua japonica]|uniref:Periplasmic protein n=1 Tax=Candidatus Scalindua japonica TaxID=1284222 RepID=A0A286TTD6_9BACT|nr:polysaccharide biosynthesis/export family protein [Candidatus Scalindua japonica]GAX59179.1 periplasmic protein [Candidatus Scalindua japonica]
MIKHIILFSSLTVCLSLISCAYMNSPTDLEVLTFEAENSSASEPIGDYVLKQGDSLDVKYFYNSELNVNVVIRLDGKISLQLIGELVAAGLTPSELQATIIEKYKGILRKPEVTIFLKEFEEEKVYVGGEVDRPGDFSINIGNTTVLQSIFKAGGFKETSDPGSVIIVRRGPENMPVTRKVNLKEVISGKAPEKDIYLQPFDIVFVPKTFIAKANKSVEQYIKNMIPVTLSTGFSYFRGKTRTKNSGGGSFVAP